VAALEQELKELIARRDAVQTEVADLTRQRDALRYQPDHPAAPDAEADASASGSDAAPEPLELGNVARELADKSALLVRLDQQIEARSRALPIFRETMGTEDLVTGLRTRRDHPLHVLLRRMYHETRS